MKTIHMPHKVESVIDAMAILDFLLGDEWAGMTAEYAEAHALDAIQCLESHGAFLDRYAPLRHTLVWGQELA